MHVSASNIMLIAGGFVVLGIIILALAKAGIFKGVSGDYYWNFVNALNQMNQTY